MNNLFSEQHQQQQHQMSDYEAELEGATLAGAGSLPGADNESAGRQPAIDSSSSSMMQPEQRPQAVARPASSGGGKAGGEQNRLGGRGGEGNIGSNNMDSTPQRARPTTTQPSSTRKPAGERPEVTTTTTTTAPTTTPQTTPSPSTLARASTTTAPATTVGPTTAQAATTTTTTTSTPTTTVASSSAANDGVDVNETPITFGGGSMPAIPTDERVQSQQQPQPGTRTTISGDRIALQNGRPATSGMMLINGASRPQLFGTTPATSAQPTTSRSGPISTTTTTATSSASGSPMTQSPEQVAMSTPTTTTTTTSAPLTSVGGERESASSSSTSAPGATSAVAGEPEAGGDETEESDESDGDNGAANLNNSGGNNATLTEESDADDDADDDTEDVTEQAGPNMTTAVNPMAVGATQTTTGAAGSESARVSLPTSTTSKPAGAADIERMTKNEPGTTISSQTLSVSSGSDSSMAPAPAPTTTTTKAANQQVSRKQQPLVMTLDASMGALDGDSGITVPMDPLMRMMLTGTSTTAADAASKMLALNQEIQRTTAATSTLAPQQVAGSSDSGLQQNQQKTTTTTATTLASLPTSAATENSSTSAAQSDATRKRLQPPPTTRVPMSVMSSIGGQADSNEGALTDLQQSQLDRQMLEAQLNKLRAQMGRFEGDGATPVTTTQQSTASSPVDSSQMSTSKAQQSISSMSADDESGGREPKIELLNMDLVPIQRLMSSMATASTPQPQQQQTTQPTTATKTSQTMMTPAGLATTKRRPTAMSTTTTMAMTTPVMRAQQVQMAAEMAAANGQVEPGMRLRPPASDQRAVTMISGGQQQSLATSSMGSAPTRSGATQMTVKPQSQQQLQRQSTSGMTMTSPNQANTVYMIMMPQSGNEQQFVNQSMSGIKQQQQQQQDEVTDAGRSPTMRQMLSMIQAAQELDQQRTRTSPAAGTAAQSSMATTMMQQQRQQQTTRQPFDRLVIVNGMTAMTTPQPKTNNQQQQTTTTTASQPSTSGQQMMVSMRERMPTSVGPKFVSLEQFNMATATAQPGTTTTTAQRSQTQAKQTTSPSGTSRVTQSASTTTSATPTTTTTTGGVSPTQRPATTTTITTTSSAPTTTTTPTTSKSTSQRGQAITSAATTSPSAAASSSSRQAATDKQTTASSPTTTKSPPTSSSAAAATTTTTESPVRAENGQTGSAQLDDASRNVMMSANLVQPSNTTTSFQDELGDNRRQQQQTAKGKSSASKSVQSSFIPSKLRSDFNSQRVQQNAQQANEIVNKNKNNKAAALQQQQPALEANDVSQALPTSATMPAQTGMTAIRQFGGANRMSALKNSPVAFGRPATMSVAPQGASTGLKTAKLMQQQQQQQQAPTFEYGPAIAVRRPDEPLANGQMPNCTLTGKNFCVITKDYPMNEVRQAVERSFRSVRLMYEELQTVSDQDLHKDDEPPVLIEGGGAVNVTTLTTMAPSGNHSSSGKFAACQTKVEMLRPGWARDEISKEWLVVVNTDVFPQRVRTESCAQPNAPCEFVAPFHDSHCQQRYSLHRFIAVDPQQPSRVTTVLMRFKAGCNCFLKRKM